MSLASRFDGGMSARDGIVGKGQVARGVPPDGDGIGP
jgi:hypothetical protein